jgi:hypothetical protein
VINTTFFPGVILGKKFFILTRRGLTGYMILNDFKPIQLNLAFIKRVAHKYFPAQKKKRFSREDRLFGQDRVRWRAEIDLWDDGDYCIRYVHGDKKNFSHEFCYHDSKQLFVYRIIRKGTCDEDTIIKEEKLLFEKKNGDTKKKRSR